MPKALAKPASAKAAPPSTPDAPAAIRVAIAGGGIAGLAAALRLAQRGYSVTLYEEKPWLGGNLGAYRDPGSGAYHDVFPHMFSNFYVNFWDIAENDLGLKRNASATSDFESRDSFAMLSQALGYRVLRNAAGFDPRLFWQDLVSGVAGLSPPQMYLYLYSVLDLIAQRFERRGPLGQSLGGFLQARPCATEPVVAAHDALVMFIWSVHAEDVSASSYRSFFRHAFGNLKPLLWLLKRNLQEGLIDPLEARLLALGCTIHKGVRVQQVVRDQRRVVALGLRRTRFDALHQRVLPTAEVFPAAAFDHLVLAVPPDALGDLADSGGAAQRLSTVMPLLAHAGQRLPSEPIAVLDLYFTRAIAGIPRENVAITDSDCDLSFIDLGLLWPQLLAKGNTVLSVSASDYWALPSDDDHDNAHHMIRELSHYLAGFNPGQRWGDPQADIDWGRSFYRANTDHPIFVNQVGSWTYRPETHSPTVDNLYFAGDFCRNHIDMATVEAAVSSGINAAAALQQRQPRGEAIVTRHPPVWSDRQIAALKLLMAPSAYAAKAWLTACDLLRPSSTDSRRSPNDRITAAATLLRLPSCYLGDVGETLGSVWGGAQAGGED